VNFRYYLKFYSARTAFCRVIEGVMSSAGHHTIFVWDLYNTIPTVPIRASYDVWQVPGSLNKSADPRPGTGRCPSGHRPMFYESNCHRWEAMCFCKSTYCIWYFTCKDQKHKFKYIIRLSSWGWLACNEQVLSKILQSLASVGFTSITVRASLNLSYFNYLFLWRNYGEF